MFDHGSERGQASVELVALLPLMAALLLVAWQGVVAGQTWWLAGGAASAAARAAGVGADPGRAARRAVPPGLRGPLRVSRRGRVIVVRIPVAAVAGLGQLGTATARVRVAGTRAGP